MHEIKVYNTLTRKIEVFKPIKDKEVRMYSCGPTVYDRIHIGNLRAAVFPDTLKRMLEYNSFSVTHVMNITDVGHLVSDGDDGEDKMTKALKREKMPITLEAMHDATRFFEMYVDDLKKLNIILPSKFPRASDYISEDIDMVKILEKNGFTYSTDDGLYFDTSRFPSYGKLGNIDIQSLKEGARVSTNAQKKNMTDFALWKLDKKLGWESPWGRGFPGWHIECSVMSTKFLGQPFDIHTGAIDLIPIHHNNEIAQSEAAYGKTFVDYWMHNEFIIVDNRKMAKSKGDVFNIETLEKQSISPIAYRYWLLTGHYRSPMNFTFDAVNAAQNALIRLMSIVAGYPEGGSIIPEYRSKFLEAINDDLDTPRALAMTWDLIRDPAHTDANKRATILDFDRVFGLNVKEVPKANTEAIPPEITILAEERETARKQKDWKKADALRIEIEQRGFILKDTGIGLEIRQKD